MRQFINDGFIFLSNIQIKNKYIGSIIHRIQAQAEIDTGKANRKWIEYLPTIIHEININVPDRKVTQENDFPIISNSNKKLLGIGKMVRTLLGYPQDVNGKRLGGTFRSSDIRWSREEYAITEVLLKPDAPPMYITTKDNVARTRGQLQVL